MSIYQSISINSQEFDPVFKKVAKSLLKKNENIVFGKIDGTVNDKPYMFPDLKV